MVLSGHPKILEDYAAFTNQGFLLHEVTLAAALQLQGASSADLIRAVVKDNCFQLRSEASRKTYLRTVQSRLQGVGGGLLSLLTDADLLTRRLTNLYLLLLNHRLLREFIHEVLWLELRRLQTRLLREQIERFFVAQQQLNPVVAGWSEATVQKCRSNIVRICQDAWLLTDGQGARYIQPQQLPTALRSELQAAERQAFFKLLLDQRALQ